jgi:hypothetical protein
MSIQNVLFHNGATPSVATLKMELNVDGITLTSPFNTATLGQSGINTVNQLNITTPLQRIKNPTVNTQYVDINTVTGEVKVTDGTNLSDLSLTDLNMTSLLPVAGSTSLIQTLTNIQGPTGGFVTINTDQTINGVKTFTNEINGTATNANNVNITSTNNTGTYFLPFVSNTGYTEVYIDNVTTPLTYNPSTSTLTTSQTQLNPPSNLPTTLVPYGLSINSAGIKTYPTTADFYSYPIIRITGELGTNQTYTSGLNFIYGDDRSYTKSAGTTSDIERLYFTGFRQSFNWTDANTCKQYEGIADSFVYGGINANGRTSAFFGADSITLTCPSSSTQTIATIRAFGSTGLLRINATNANATYTITNSSATNLRFLGSATNVIANITNHSFFENSSFWDGSWTGAGSLATITNMYGLRLHPPSGGTTTGLTITNNWGIYSGWSSAKNYFAGGVGIGTTSISNALDVVGNASISLSLQVPKITNTASIELAPNTTTGDLILTGTNLQSATHGGNSGQHLRIKLNGTYYKIKLEND